MVNIHRVKKLLKPSASRGDYKRIWRYIESRLGNVDAIRSNAHFSRETIDKINHLINDYTNRKFE